MPRYVEGVNYEFLPGETKDERKKRLNQERRARYYGHTKEQHNERNKAWRENNPDKNAARLKRWRTENKDKVKQQKAEWNRKNVEKIREQHRLRDRRRRKLSPDKVAAEQERWRAKDPEKAKLINRAIAARYRERHPDRVKEQQKTYSKTLERAVQNRRNVRRWQREHPKLVLRYSRRAKSRKRMTQGLPPIEPRDTAIKKQVFLETFKGCGNITIACEAAGCSRAAVAEWRVFDENFERAYEEARIQSIEILEAVARQRAMAGSDRMLVFLLRSYKPELYGQKVEPQVYLRTEAEKLAAEFGVPFEQVYNELLARANERTASRPQQLVGPGRRATEPTR